MNFNILSGLVTVLRPKRDDAKLVQVERDGNREPALEVDLAEIDEGRESRTTLFWILSIAGGFVFTVLVFLFLGSLQPGMNDGSRIEVPAMIKFDLGMAKAKKPPPPPAKEKPKPEPKKRVKRQKPKPQKKAPSRQARQVARRVQTTAAPQMRSAVNMGLQGISLTATTSGLGGGGLALDLSEQLVEFTTDALEMAQYERQRQAVRERTYEMQQAMASQAGGMATRAQLTYKKDPNYPPAARKSETEGEVLLEVLISIDGSVEEFEIISASPAGVFEDSISEALPRWQFKPATDPAGRPMEERKRFKYEFKLENA